MLLTAATKKPTCPRSGEGSIEHAVSNVSGAGGRKRTYKCTCGCVWNQVSPDSIQVSVLRAFIVDNGTFFGDLGLGAGFGNRIT